ncbi:MAG: LuxR C-terminal-related transcriptional regulator [Sporichthyaceae bacterium]|nr:LuxR C-terminal-related transcriptional regulator [Sporichthyaceae bacterium]
MRRAELERLRGRPLTRTQAQVLTLLAEGRTFGEIARTLHLARTSVWGHTQQIKAKLGAADRTHAVAIALRTGVIR